MLAVESWHSTSSSSRSCNSVTDPRRGCFTAFPGLVGSIKIREGAGEAVSRTGESF